MVTTRHLPAFFTLVLGLAVGSVSADDFAWKFKKGEQYEFSVRQSMTQTVPTPQGAIDTKIDMELIGGWDITDVGSGGDMEISQRIKRMAMKIKAPGPTPEIVIDSDKLGELKGPVAQRIGSSLGKLKKLEFIKTITPLGKVVKAELKHADAVAGLPGLTPEAIKEMSADLLLEFPAGSLETGRTWEKTQTQKLPNVGAMEIVTKYKYVGSEKVNDRELAKFEINGTIKAGGAAKNGANQPKVNGTVEGVLYFDRAAGRVSHGTTAAEMKIPTTVLGQSIVIKMKVESATELGPVPSEKETLQSQGSP